MIEERTNDAYDRWLETFEYAPEPWEASWDAAQRADEAQHRMNALEHIQQHLRECGQDYDEAPYPVEMIEVLSCAVGCSRTSVVTRARAADGRAYTYTLSGYDYPGNRDEPPDSGQELDWRAG